GEITGLPGLGTSQMQLRLQPQPNNFLHGEMLINQSGFGEAPIEGFVRDNHLQFQVPYGTEIYYFEGERESALLSGTFRSQPSGASGTWTAQAN
ncbi:MAG TPA: hypothetical protein VEJ86_04050, partial [Candidatus Binataceae bacterium]|nr:hypothetical protein [Candidatus Binataceae bacterium]